MICSFEASALVMFTSSLSAIPHDKAQKFEITLTVRFSLGMCTSHMLHLIKKRMSALAGLAHATGINVNIQAPVAPSVSLPFDT